MKKYIKPSVGFTFGNFNDSLLKFVVSEIKGIFFVLNEVLVLSFNDFWYSQQIWITEFEVLFDSIWIKEGIYIWFTILNLLIDIYFRLHIFILLFISQIYMSWFSVLIFFDWLIYFIIIFKF